MRTVDLWISSIDDTRPILTQKNKVLLRVSMDDIQIAYNRLVLLDMMTRDREMSKIRVVK